MRYILTSLFFLMGCIPTYKTKVYFFPIAEKMIVVCRNAIERPCGMELSKCSNNVVYYCVERVGMIEEEKELF